MTQDLMLIPNSGYEIWENPFEDWEEEDSEFALVPRRKRNVTKSQSTFQPSFFSLALIGVAGWLGYYFWKHKKFPWQSVAKRVSLAGNTHRPPEFISNQVKPGFQNIQIW